MTYKQPGFTPFTLSPHASPQYRLNAAIRNNKFEYNECMRKAKVHGPEAIAKCKEAKSRRQANIDRGWQNL
tara:strand:- start:1284 stop:1496 length:213 start_codon:yes stop_codon:yes gene_type:complete